MIDVPPGWQLVPIETTPEMRAALRIRDFVSGYAQGVPIRSTLLSESPDNLWARALAAAPKYALTAPADEPGQPAWMAVPLERLPFCRYCQTKLCYGKCALCINARSVDWGQA